MSTDSKNNQNCEKSGPWSPLTSIKKRVSFLESFFFFSLLTFSSILFFLFTRIRKHNIPSCYARAVIWTKSVSLPKEYLLTLESIMAPGCVRIFIYSLLLILNAFLIKIRIFDIYNAILYIYNVTTEQIDERSSKNKQTRTIRCTDRTHFSKVYQVTC